MTADAVDSTGAGHRGYLDRVTRLLWPGRTAAGVSEAGRIRLDSPGTERGDRVFAVVPNLRRPAVLVPLRPSRTTSAVLRSYKTSASPMRRRLLRLIALSARGGAGRLLPDRLIVRQAGDGIEEHLSTIVGERVSVSVMIGPARANRKPVLQLIDDHGRTRGYAKIGVDALTDDLVRHEGEALELLNRAAPPGVEVPDLVHAGVWNGHPIVVQSPVGGDAAPTTSTLAAGIRGIARVDGAARQRLSSTAYWHALGKRIDDLPPSAARDRMLSLHERVSRVHLDTVVTMGSWHGDLTPWNVAYRAGHLVVWDWERFCAGVPAGYDACHFSIQRDIVRAQSDPGAAARRLLSQGPDQDLGWVDDPAAVEATALAYLLEIGTRYVGDGLAEVGGALGDLRTWLLPAAETHLHTT